MDMAWHGMAWGTECGDGQGRGAVIGAVARCGKMQNSRGEIVRTRRSAVQQTALWARMLGWSWSWSVAGAVGGLGRVPQTSQRVAGPAPGGGDT